MAWDDVVVATVSKYTAAVHNEIVNQIKARVLHSLSTAENDFLVGTPAGGSFVKKTLAEVKTILGLGSAAYTASTDYATSGHNHSGTYEPANSNIQSHISNTSNPHSVTAAQIGYAYPQGFRISKATNSDGGLLYLRHYNGCVYPLSTGIGSKVFIYIFCGAPVTVLDIGTLKIDFFGIYDLYIDDVLDSSGYDFYNAGEPQGGLEITTASTLAAGWHTLEFRCTGKNASSSGYSLGIAGVYLR